MIKIDKGIPIPIENASAKYPWKNMGIGDSFFAPNQFTANFSQMALQAGIKIKTRTVIENGVKGRRIWRIA